MRRFGYECSASDTSSLAGELYQRLTYLAHLGGVVLINPRRAYIQAQALWRARAKHDNPASAGGPAPHVDPPQ